MKGRSILVSIIDGILDMSSRKCAELFEADEYGEQIFSEQPIKECKWAEDKQSQ